MFRELAKCYLLSVTYAESVANFLCVSGTENKSPYRRSPVKYSGRVTFDEQEDDSITIAQNTAELNGKLAEELDSGQTALEKRRASLKTTKSEVRTDSVESNEVGPFTLTFILAKK